MKSYHISRRDAAIEDVIVREHDVPRPGPREVLIRVRASSLNYRDLLMLKGYGAGVIKPNLIPLSCGAGEVVEVGAEVDRFKVGDRVAAIFRQNWIDGPSPAVVFDADLGSVLDGMLSEYRVFNEEGIVLVPRHLCFEQAATLPCAGVTAWSAITDPVPVKPGETVLIEGTGGVSLFALQVKDGGMAMEAYVEAIAPATSPTRREQIRQELIQYCALDTLAMVKVWEFFSGQVSGAGLNPMAKRPPTEHIGVSGTPGRHR